MQTSLIIFDNFTNKTKRTISANLNKQCKD